MNVKYHLNDEFVILFTQRTFLQIRSISRVVQNALLMRVNVILFVSTSYSASHICTYTEKISEGINEQ